MKIDADGAGPIVQQNPQGMPAQSMGQGGPRPQAPTRQKAQQGQDGYPDPRQTPGKKVIFTILTVGLAVAMVVFIFIGLQGRFQGTQEPVVTNTVIPAEDSADLPESLSPDLDTATKEELAAEIARLKRLNESLQTKATAPAEIPGMPPGVTAVSEWDSEAPDELNSLETRDYTELIPYTKKSIPLPQGDYMFVLIVNYGNQEYMLDINLKDYKILKQKGVIAAKVEIASVPDGDSTRDVVTSILVHPEWQRLTQLN